MPSKKVLILEPERCGTCGAVLEPLGAWSDDGQMDFPWCPACVDFVNGTLAEEYSRTAPDDEYEKWVFYGDKNE